MRTRKPKKRNAWLITWESPREDYLRDLQRPRVVAILKPQIDSSTIEKILPILFLSESRLTFSEKIGHSFFKQPLGWFHRDLQSISCGHNPWLHARRVTDLYAETYDNDDHHQTLHWMEEPRYAEDPNTLRWVEVYPARACSEDVHFDILWYGKSFLDEDTKA